MRMQGPLVARQRRCRLSGRVWGFSCRAELHNRRSTLMLAVPPTCSVCAGHTAAAAAAAAERHGCAAAAAAASAAAAAAASSFSSSSSKQAAAASSSSKQPCTSATGNEGVSFRPRPPSRNVHCGFLVDFACDLPVTQFKRRAAQQQHLEQNNITKCW